jgi:hypothetical protein
MTFEPFALTIYREHLRGKSVEQLSRQLGIPPERIALRLQAVRRWLTSQSRGPIGRAARPAHSSFAGSPAIERGNRCARCGAALDRGCFCAACRAVLATLNSGGLAASRWVQ